MRVKIDTKNERTRAASLLSYEKLWCSDFVNEISWSFRCRKNFTPKSLPCRHIGCVKRDTPWAPMKFVCWIMERKFEKNVSSLVCIILIERFTGYRSIPYTPHLGDRKLGKRFPKSSKVFNFEMKKWKLSRAKFEEIPTNLHVSDDFQKKSFQPYFHHSVSKKTHHGLLSL